MLGDVVKRMERVIEVETNLIYELVDQQTCETRRTGTGVLIMHIMSQRNKEEWYLVVAHEDFEAALYHFEEVKPTAYEREAYGTTESDFYDTRTPIYLEHAGAA